MSTQTSQQNESIIGIPLAVELHSGYCSIAVDALASFLRNVTRTQRALRDMGVNLCDAKSIQGDVQIFGLVRANDVVEAHPVERTAEANGKSERASMPAVSMVRACLKSAGVMAPAASSPTRNTERGAYDGTSIDGVDVDLIRRRVAGGPSYVVLDGKPTPWSANLTTPARGNHRPEPQPVAVEPAGDEVHLITSSNRRYHPEDAADVSEVEPGSTVVVEACSTERVLFVGSDALILQRVLEFPEDQSEP